MNILKKFKANSTLLKFYIYAFNQYKRIFCEEIIVFGDSHAKVFRNKTIILAFPKIFFNVVSVEGATVSGLENPNSKTQALPIFMKYILTSKAKIAIVLLGEVDTGFVIWYRSEKYKIPVSRILDKTLVSYQKFLLKLSKTFRIVCISAPLPTIKDRQNWGNISNLRKDIKATQLQRTKLTIHFNKKMQSFCEKYNICYMSLDDDAIGPNGLVDRKLLNSNLSDHHYSEEIYAEMIINKLHASFRNIQH